MKRIVIAVAFAMALPVGLAGAASPFDGTYTGGSPRGGVGRGSGCPATNATVTVADGKMTGKYNAGGAANYNISGTVAADGTVTGKWSVYPLTGKITGGHFAGTYTSKECGAARPISLEKSG